MGALNAHAGYGVVYSSIALIWIWVVGDVAYGLGLERCGIPCRRNDVLLVSTALILGNLGRPLAKTFYIQRIPRSLTLSDIARSYAKPLGEPTNEPFAVAGLSVRPCSRRASRHRSACQPLSVLTIAMVPL